MLWMTQYDPDETDTAPGAKSQYMTKKDARTILIAVGALIVFLIPIYLKMREKTRVRICFSNIRAAHQAIAGYMTQNEDHLPPTYYPNEKGEPVMLDGHPITWVTLVAPDMSKRSNFECPSAKPEESATSVGTSESGPILSTFGMLTSLGLSIRSDIESPSDTILLSETSNKGSETSYNPLPFGDSDDGFAIGYNKSNALPDNDEGKSTFVTRLAFRGTQGGNFSGEAVKPRHESGIHAVSFDGQAFSIQPGSAGLNRRGDDVIGRWAPSLRR